MGSGPIRRKRQPSVCRDGVTPLELMVIKAPKTQKRLIHENSSSVSPKSNRNAEFLRVVRQFTRETQIKGPCMKFGPGVTIGEY